MRLRKIIKILSIPLILLSLVWPYTSFVEAQASSQNLTPDSYTTESGSTGGQTVDALKVKDQSGNADDPQNYVAFTTSGALYKGTQIFTIPENKANTSISAMELQVNFKGTPGSSQKWSWSIYDPKNDSWTKLGTNKNGDGSNWALSKFQVDNPDAYFSSNTEIRIMLASDNTDGDAKIDYEAINITYQIDASSNQNNATPTLGSSPTPTPVIPTETAVPGFTPTVAATQTANIVIPLLTTNTTEPEATDQATQALSDTATSLPAANATQTPPANATFLPSNSAIQAAVTTVTSYYVAITGSDSNTGTLSSPFKTIQKCLNVVQPGSSCLIRAGTYNQALTLKTSGTASGLITIQNYNGEVVTVNSGSALTIQTTSAHQSYYVFDGLRLISSITGSESTKTLDFQNGWTIGYNHKAPEGNSFITLQNCYVEGEVTFYGQNNTVSNCEFNGKNSLGEAIHINYPPSVGNVVKNNKIHDYIARGIWTNGGTDSTLIQGNTVYNAQHGIDCDGAGVPVTNCKVIGNVIHDVSSSATWGSGIFLENSFNGIVNGNLIYNIPNGAGIYVINYGNGPSWHTQNNIEYRTQDLNTSVTNNVIFNNPASPAILDTSASGLKIFNNTFYSSGTGVMIYMKVEPSTTFYPHNMLIRDNIFSDRSASVAIRMDNVASLTGSVFSNNLFWTGTNTHKVGTTSYTLAAFKATGQEVGSISADPKFVTPGSNFRLQAGSPAIDKGFTTGVTSDFLGIPRPHGASYDIGAYEY